MWPLTIATTVQGEEQAVGELKTRQVMHFWTGDRYQWIDETVVTRPRDIGAVLRAHNLVPPQ